jgi:hypothetical protein
MAEKEAEEVAEGQEEDQEEEAAAETADEPAAPKSFDELKVVLIIKEGNIMAGVQCPECDPIYQTFKGTLDSALKKVPKLIEDAKKKWGTSPRYPEANLPKPPAPAAPTRSSRPAPEKKKQPSFF